MHRLQSQRLDTWSSPAQAFFRQRSSSKTLLVSCICSKPRFGVLLHPSFVPTMATGSLISLNSGPCRLSRRDFSSLPSHLCASRGQAIMAQHRSDLAAYTRSAKAGISTALFWPGTTVAHVDEKRVMRAEVSTSVSTPAKTIAYKLIQMMRLYRIVDHH